MDRQCEDRAHRIGQIRDVHIYRFISQYTVEEAMLRKANQKRSLDDLVIQQGDFDWRRFFGADGDGDGNVNVNVNVNGGGGGGGGGGGRERERERERERRTPGKGSLLGAGARARALQKALVEFEDYEDALAAKVAASEEAAILGEDRNEFGETTISTPTPTTTLVEGGIQSRAQSQPHSRETPSSVHDDEALLTPIPEATPAPIIVTTNGRNQTHTHDEDDTNYPDTNYPDADPDAGEEEEENDEEGEGEGSETVTDYMLRVVRSDREFFKEMALR